MQLLPFRIWRARCPFVMPSRVWRFGGYWDSRGCSSARLRQRVTTDDMAAPALGLHLK